MEDITNLEGISQKMRRLIWTRDKRLCRHCQQLVYRTLTPRGLIHHIDLDRTNNHASNLVLLCGK